MSVYHIENVEHVAPVIQGAALNQSSQMALSVAHQFGGELDRKPDELDLGFFLHNSSCCPRGESGAAVAGGRPANHKPSTAWDHPREAA